MVSYSEAEYIAHLSKTGRQRADISPSAVSLESPLHRDIMDFCDQQWPRWKYRHARMDKRTREELGIEDFTIFLPDGKTLHVECKARDEKQSKEQCIWAKELEMLGHTVYVVRSMEDFRAVLERVGCC